MNGSPGCEPGLPHNRMLISAPPLVQTWLWSLGGGVLCGFLNAAASSGSAITLPLLLSLGLPPSVANGTNRVGVLAGMVTAAWRFHRAGAIPWRLIGRLLPAFLGMAVLGAIIAAVLPMRGIRLLIDGALLLALLMVLLRPHRLLKDDGRAEDNDHRPSPTLQVLMGGVGFWTGLIVLDAATYLLVALVLIGGLSLPRANVIKVVLVGTATIASLVVFIAKGEIDWFASLPLLVGSALGGWLGAALALGPNARLWIYRLLIGTLGLETLGMLWHWLRALL